jgi:orotate phosphoribosyltransferase
MKDYKKEFIDFLVEAQALKFGDFVTKSGRNTPFFINLGCFNDGKQLQKLGGFYAETIFDNFGKEVDVLFGPAYKGIPIATATAIALNEKFGVNVRYCSNRKEIKDHGDSGIFLGSKLQNGDRVVIVEDVTTAGTSVYETMELVKDLGVKVLGLVVSVDRMERGKTEKSAIAELSSTFDFKGTSIVNMEEVTNYLSKEKSVLDKDKLGKIADYYKQYGAKN